MLGNVDAPPRAREPPDRLENPFKSARVPPPGGGKYPTFSGKAPRKRLGDPEPATKRRRLNYGKEERIKYRYDASRAPIYRGHFTDTTINIGCKFVWLIASNTC